MAQKVTVALEDDLDGGAAEETVRFGFDGTDYEIDLSGKDFRSFRAQLAPFIEHARKIGRGPARRAGRTAAGRQRSGAIRAWAKEQASRSVSAGGSRSAWCSSTRPLQKDAEPHAPAGSGRARVEYRSLTVSGHSTDVAPCRFGAVHRRSA